MAGPLHLYDCVMPCAGGEGFLMMSEERARRLDPPYARVLAAEELHNAFAPDPVQLRAGWESFATWLTMPRESHRRKSMCCRPATIAR